MHRRIGHFRLPRDVFDLDVNYVADVMAALRVVVVRCELMHETNDFWYTAVCGQFREKAAGEKVPNYIIEVETADGKVKKATAVEETREDG